ncbi:MPT63 family protein [Mycobacterium sp.]|uniref:MPT63 family protein n=1 Tax=Mycobacterium sp. TaxID=1785 RepID=UPI003BAEEAAE
MKFTTTTMRTAIGAAGIAAVSLATAGSASAAPNIQGFGTSEPLVDGPMVTNYTVSNLQPSTISIPGFTPKGTLYQADVTVRSDGGVVTPQVRDFSARGPNGQTYKLIDNVEVPNGLNPAPIAQGSESKGTLYFDATGAPPNGVVYNDGLQDILMWTSNVPGASQNMPGMSSNMPGMSSNMPGMSQNMPGAAQNMPAPGEPGGTGPAPGALPAPATT